MKTSGNTIVTAAILAEADRTAEQKGWTRPFALSIMQWKALASGTLKKADAIMALLEREVLNAPADELLGG
jgi:hypothetical protein